MATPGDESTADDVSTADEVSTADDVPTADDRSAALLLEAGETLARAVAAAVPGWVRRCVVAELDAWGALGVGPGRDAVVRDADEAGRAARGDVEPQLLALARLDVDAQSTTPLSIVRGAVAYPTEVLRRAGVPARRRDPFAAERFPADVYGLVPASLAALDPSLLDLAVAWGAAKAMAHRRRHSPPPESAPS